MMCVLSFVYVCNAKCPNCPYNNSTIRNAYKDALYMPEALFSASPTNADRTAVCCACPGAASPCSTLRPCHCVNTPKPGAAGSGSLPMVRALTRIPSAGSSGPGLTPLNLVWMPETKKPMARATGPGLEPPQHFD